MTIPAPPAPAGVADFLPEQPFRSGGGPASPAETQRLLGEGLIRHVVADVFVAADIPDSLRVRAAAAALLIPPRRRRDQSWVVGFTSAVWIHTGWRPAGGPSSPTGVIAARASPRDGAELAVSRLDVIVPAGCNRPSDPLIRARQARLLGTEVVLLHELPVTDPVRTAADVARELPAAHALAALRCLGELMRVRPEQVLHRLAAMRYARGAATARAVVGTWQEQGG